MVNNLKYSLLIDTKMNVVCQLNYCIFWRDIKSYKDVINTMHASVRNNSELALFNDTQ